MGFFNPPTHTPITTISDSKSYLTISPLLCAVYPLPKNYFHGKIDASAKGAVWVGCYYAALWGLTINSLPPQVIIAFLRCFMVSVAYLVCLSFKPLSLELIMLIALW